MKKNIAIILMLVIFGCNESFLDLHSRTDLSSGNFWKNEKDVQLALNGIYDVLQSRPLYGGNWNNKISLVNYDSFVDNSWNRIRFEGAGFYIRGTLNESERLFEDLWGASYRGISRCNEAIFNIEKMAKENLLNETTINDYMGQVYFLRGLFYSHLAIYFEHVPLILNMQTLDEAYVTKNNQREILDQVIKDLELAAELLPEEHPSELFGYATKGAANGLLARIFLFDKQWTKAAEASKKVIDSNLYNLDFTYDKQFTYDGEYSKDIVFSVRFQEAEGFASTEQFSITNLSMPKWNNQPYANCVNDFYCTDGMPIDKSPLYNSKSPKENRDPRLLASVYFKGDVFITDLNIVFKTSNTGYGIKKYVRSKTTDLGTNPNSPGGQDFYVIRYADVLLMRAEALVESNTNLNEVYSLINEVRDRVGMPHVEDVEGAGLSQDQLREIVRHERRVELAFEGLRFFDLKRWGLVEEAYQRIKTDPSEFPDRNVVIYQGRKSETFPIPLSELDANPNLIQHEAWE